MKKNMRFSIEFIFVVRFWVYRQGGGEEGAVQDTPNTLVFWWFILSKRFSI